MKTKEEAIKKAWIDLIGSPRYSIRKDKIDENGYLSYCTPLNLFVPLELCESHPKRIDWQTWRPKSLQGIEDNNGWTRVESNDDLPKIGGYDMSSFELYYFTTNGLYKATDYIKWCVHVVDIQITHYRLEPVFKPKKPIY